MIKHIFVKVPDMHCAACSTRVEKVLNNLEGVMEANVNLATFKASVKYDTDKVNIDKIKDTIIKAGYTPELLEDSSIKKQTFLVEGMT